MLLPLNAISPCGLHTTPRSIFSGFSGCSRFFFVGPLVASLFLFYVGLVKMSVAKFAVFGAANHQLPPFPSRSKDDPPLFHQNSAAACTLRNQIAACFQTKRSSLEVCSSREERGFKFLKRICFVRQTRPHCPSRSPSPEGTKLLRGEKLGCN